MLRSIRRRWRVGQSTQGCKSKKGGRPVGDGGPFNNIMNQAGLNLLRGLIEKWTNYRNQRPRSFNGEMADEVALEREDRLMGEFLRDLAALASPALSGISQPGTEPPLGLLMRASAMLPWCKCGNSFREHFQATNILNEPMTCREYLPASAVPPSDPPSAGPAQGISIGSTVHALDEEAEDAGLAWAADGEAARHPKEQW